VKLSLIWAMDEQGLIGVNNKLPWKLPADMAWFRKNTLGKPILMGRKTFDSIGKPLPKRHNFILTTQVQLHIDGCSVVHDIGAAMQEAESLSQGEELMVIGGAEVYRLCLPQASRLYVTRIHEQFEGDAWFPEIDWSDWQLVSSQEYEADAENSHAYGLMVYQRTEASPGH